VSEGVVPDPGRAPAVHPAVVAKPRGTVLLADDDEDMRLLITECLRRDGYAVIVCADGRGVVDRLESAPPDILVCDVSMPGPSGLDVLTSLRDRRVVTPVILISAFDDEQTRHSAVELGATAFLRKPFHLDELRALLGHFCPSPR
jgi:DNA-binding response OmpR family regulator